MSRKGVKAVSAAVGTCAYSFAAWPAHVSRLVGGTGAEWEVRVGCLRQGMPVLSIRQRTYPLLVLANAGLIAVVFACNFIYAAVTLDDLTATGNHAVRFK